jgi:hypothetical protein
MKIIPKSHLRPLSDGYSRRQTPVNPTAPLRTQREVATILGLTPAQVAHAERLALLKIRAALSAYGYNKDTP